MKILVTGGAGFMGSSFIRYILNKYPDYKIINLDKLTYAGNLENLRDIEENPNYKFYKGDICNQKIVHQLVRGVDAIINYAAETHVDRSIMEPDVFIKTDVFGTYTLLEAAKEFKTKKFIQIGTDEVYGSIAKGSFKESDSLKPNSPYSASKAAADHLCRAYFVTYNLPIIMTRSCNNYGPNQYPEKLIPLFITNLIENKKVPIYGKGNQSREWIYVLDHARAIDLILHQGKIGEVYNIGTGEEVKNIKTAKILLKLLGKNEKMIEYVADRPGHDVRYSLNTEKIKRLGFIPDYDFEMGIKATVDWYQNNVAWWQKIKMQNDKSKFKTFNYHC